MLVGEFDFDNHILVISSQEAEAQIFNRNQCKTTTLSSAFQFA
jgi:hypothetical protein